MEMGKKKAPEGFLPEPFLPASPFLKGTYSRTFNFITLVLILPLVLPHGVIGPSAKKRMDTAGMNPPVRDYFSINYLTIALTAASPSTATTTTPAGAAIVALSEAITVLATT